MERKLIANHLVPDDEVWVSPKTWDIPFTQSNVAGVPTSNNTAMLKLLCDVEHAIRNGLSYSVTKESNLYKNIVEEIAKHQHS